MWSHLSVARQEQPAVSDSVSRDWERQRCGDLPGKAWKLALKTGMKELMVVPPLLRVWFGQPVASKIEAKCCCRSQVNHLVRLARGY